MTLLPGIDDYPKKTSHLLAARRRWLRFAQQQNMNFLSNLGDSSATTAAARLPGSNTCSGIRQNTWDSVTCSSLHR